MQPEPASRVGSTQASGRMGDRSHVKLYSELLAFLEANGRPLNEHGSAERGLSIEKALGFLDLLLANGVPLIGVEIWRDVGGSRYRMSGLETWYPTRQDARAVHADALQHLSHINAGPNDVFAVQFG